MNLYVSYCLFLTDLIVPTIDVPTPDQPPSNLLITTETLHAMLHSGKLNNQSKWC
jgi:hypothetical protein